ncbi:MAG: hypothetical protein HQM09_21835 [Candidatus Riflebacteria bacterium]|nr:hypothetical protein [Candidatus Riflebacteria bacterium]
MKMQNRRGAPWLYLVLALVAITCLYLFGWPIVRQVILHRGMEEAIEETGRDEKYPVGSPMIPTGSPSKKH